VRITDIEKFQKAVDQVYTSDKYQKIREKMRKYLKYYRGEFWPQNKEHHSPADSEIFVNYIFSTAMTIMPLLTDNRPTWYIRARKAFTQRYFDIFNDGLDYLWDTLECDMKLSKVVLVALLMKVGIWKVYWDRKASPTGEIGVEVLDPTTFVIAPGYDDPWEAPWSGTYGDRPLTWVWDHFPEKAKKIKANKDSESETDEDRINATCKVYEIYIKDDSVEKALSPDEKPKKKYPYGRYVIFTDQRDEKDNLIVLYDKPYKYKHAKPPFVCFYDYWNPFEFHGMGEPDQIETMTLEFNIQIKRLANYCRRWTGLNICMPPMTGLDSEQFKKEIIKGEDNVWQQDNVEEIPKPIVWPQINRTLLEFISAIPKLIEEVSGVTETSKGKIGKKERQTAGEIATLIESSYTRTRQRVRNLEASVKRACYLFVSLMQQFYTEPKDFTKKVGDETVYGQVTSNPRYLRESMKPKEPKKRDFTFFGLRDEIDPEDREEYERQLEDYEKFFEVYGKDPVYADFDIEIQTNSTLPMDRQSLANLFLRLFEMQAIDQLALLRQLRVPNAEEIVERMQKIQQMPQPKPAPQGEMNVQQTA